MTHTEIAIVDHIGADMATITKYLLVALLLSGCVTRFDSVEYEYLTLLSIQVENTHVCTPDERATIHSLAFFLYRYTEHSTDKKTASVYSSLYDMTRGLVREGPVSVKYCELKMKNIQETVDQIRTVYGRRQRN